MRNLFFWLALPFLIPQALRIRRTAPRFSAAAGPRSGSAGTGRERMLLAIGDSIIDGVGARQLPDALVGQTAGHLAERLGNRISWSAAGRSGATCATIRRELLGELPVGRADFIIVSAGVNDVIGLTRASAWRADIVELVRELNVRYPHAVIAVAGLPPLGGFPVLPQPLRFFVGLRGAAFDGIARSALAQFDYVRHVRVEFDTTAQDFADDGFHPSEQSYSVFGAAMADALVSAKHRATG